MKNTPYFKFFEAPGEDCINGCYGLRIGMGLIGLAEGGLTTFAFPAGVYFFAFRQGVSAMYTLFKHHHIQDYWERHIHAIAMLSGSLALLAFVLAVCFALLIFSDTTVMLLQLLQWVGRDCLWCTITPS